MGNDDFDLLGDSDDDMGFGEELSGGELEDVSENRESDFNIESGRFHDDETGEFEPGSPPPDLGTSVDRYRAEDGKFKGRSKDLFDEPEEVRLGSLEPEG